jgi:uncharacterized protein (DUF305 family)
MADRSRRDFLVAASAGTAGVLAGVLLPVGSDSPSDQSLDAAPAPTAVDVGFCTDMTAHHVQALAMCQRVLGRDTGDPVQAAASEVLQNQAIEVGMMRAWLTDWGQSAASPELSMGWMDVNDGAGMPLAMMPGLASDDEMRGLSQASGRGQGRKWVELMRAHHVGGVTPQ